MIRTNDTNRGVDDAWPTKPLVWLFEGDFIPYAGSSQAKPRTMTKFIQLAADITCAIDQLRVFWDDFCRSLKQTRRSGMSQ